LTDHKPKPCHYDRTLKARITRDGDPCPQPHCILCQRRHLDTSHPVTCPECIGEIRTDLHEILWSCRHLRWQAVRGGSDGRLIAAAPIPGGDAMIMITRAGANYEDLIWHPKIEADHKHIVVPPLLPLLGWEHQWRTYFDQHQRTATGRHPLTAVIHYLADHLTAMAQAVDGPDWPGMARGIGDLRRQLEAVLHDEQAGEHGVSCFECGDTLVRRFGKPRPCRHRTPARDHLEQTIGRGAVARVWLQLLATYPEAGGPTHAEIRAARPPTSAEVSAARIPCPRCVASTEGQGGIEDPSVGQSWECVGCRKRYTPGEYGNAVRSDLLRSGPGRDGWTHISMAAEAATTQTGVVINPATVRKWMDRGHVGSVCRWSAGVRAGLRLVYWPDVAQLAADAVVRAHLRETARRFRAEQKAALAVALEAGEDPKKAGVRLRIHPQRLVRLLDELSEAKAG
jgi:hypothetical protein